MPPEPHLSLMVDALVARDGVQPGRELGVSTEIAGALDHLHPYVLIDLLGPSAIAHRTQNHVEEGTPIAREQGLERLGVAFSIRRQQPLVGPIRQNPPLRAYR